LAPLDAGEADSICIAGVGVDTMLSILQSPRSNNEDHSNGKTRYLDDLQCQSLYLQPPTSRPRKMMELYKEVQIMGFVLANERIVKLKERWYITSQFERSNDHMHLLPGHYLLQSSDAGQKREYNNYVEHHLQWLDKDFGKNGELCEHDKEWRDSNHQRTLGKRDDTNAHKS
jgi:tRNA A22 N-methylase